MVARTCGMADNVKTDIEQGPTWTYSLALARNVHKLPFLGPKLVEEYRKHLEKPYIFVEKSNCNHFIADYLKEQIPEMKFIVLLRDIYGNVCSQLRRTGNYERIMGDSLYFSMPAPFYGIESVDYYGWSFIERLCYRWFVNRKALIEVVDKYNDDCIVFDYEDWVSGPEWANSSVGKLEEFLGTAIPFNKHFYQYGNHLNYLWNLSIDQKAFIKDYYEKHKGEPG